LIRRLVAHVHDGGVGQDAHREVFLELLHCDVETDLVDHAADDEIVLQEAGHRARDRAGRELGREGSVGLADDHGHRSPVDGIPRLENRHGDRNRQRRDQDDEPRLAFQGLQILPQWRFRLLHVAPFGKGVLLFSS
jgi:hypothetical protein